MKKKPSKKAERLVNAKQTKNAAPAYARKTKQELIDELVAVKKRLARMETADEVLRKTDDRLSAITTSANDAIIMLDGDGKVSFWNPAAEHIFGYSETEIIGKHLHTLVLPEQYREKHKLGIDRFRKSGKGKVIGKTLELTGMRKDGQEFPLELSLSALKIGRIWHSIGIVRDITERKKSEVMLRRLNRELQAITAIDKSLIRATEESEFLREACMLVVGIGGYRMAWIGMAQNDREKSIVPVAQAGFEDNYLSNIKVTWADTKVGQGPVGRAIRSRSAALVKNVLTDPSFTLWKKNAATRGYASVASLPLVTAGTVLGALTVYSSEVDSFSGEEVNLLMDLAEDIAFGITAIRTRTDRGRAEEALRKQEQELQVILNAVPAMIFYKDRENRFVRVNRAFTEITGLSREEVEGKTALHITLDKKLAEQYWEDDKEVMRTGMPKRNIIEPIKTDRTIWLQTDKIPYRNEQGKIVGVIGFAIDITARVTMEEERRKILHDLTERLKELNCLYGVLQLVADRNKPLDEIFRKTVELVPSSWQYPDITCARITFNGHAYMSQTFRETAWKQTANIVANGKKVGSVEIHYMERKPNMDEGPFLEEERNLIEALARQLGQIVEHKRAEEELERHQLKLEETVQKRTGELRKANKELKAQIADRRQAEEEVRNAHTLLDKMFSSLEEAVLILDAETRDIISCNSAVEKIFGYKKDELMGKNTEILHISRKMYEEFGKRFYASLDREDIFRSEFKAKRKDGTMFFSDHTITQIKDDNGERTEFVSLVRDITERKMAEKVLMESEERYRLLVESGLLIAWEISLATSSFTFVSRQAEKLLGYPIAEWYTLQFWRNHIHPEDRERVTKEARARIDEGEDYTLEYRMLAKDGRALWFRDLVSITKDPHGKPSELRGFSLEITGLKEAEDNLRKAKTSAEEATRLKDKFVSLVSHDLKSPLGSVLNLLKIIRNDSVYPLHSEVARKIDLILESGKKMSALVNNLLSISRLKTGKLKPRSRFVDAHELVACVLAAFAHHADRKVIDLINNVPPETRLYADPDLFGEVIHNLVSNAIKFSRSGEAVMVYMPDNRASTIAVADNGEGILPEILENIFNYEVKTSTAGTIGETGSGLALPLCREIMEAHNGSLTIETSADDGSTFYAELPNVRPVVIVLDHAEDKAEALKTELAQIDILDVRTAEPTAETFATARKCRPHLILLDITAKKLNGLDCLKHIRDDDILSETKVIAIVPKEDLVIRDTVRKLGVDEIVDRSSAVSELVPSIQRLLF